MYMLSFLIVSSETVRPSNLSYAPGNDKRGSLHVRLQASHSQNGYSWSDTCVSLAGLVDRPGLGGGGFRVCAVALHSNRTTSPGHLQGIASTRLVSVAKGRGRRCITAGRLLLRHGRNSDRGTRTPDEAITT